MIIVAKVDPTRPTCANANLKWFEINSITWADKRYIYNLKISIVEVI